MRERDAAVERWLPDEVIAGHSAYLADPSQGVPGEEILDRIKARRPAIAAAGSLHASSLSKAETG
jgi:antitoxin ParD1/3/4